MQKQGALSYLMGDAVFHCLALCISLSRNSVYSFRIVSILFSDKGFMDDRVAGIAKLVLISLRQWPFKSTSKL